MLIKEELIILFSYKLHVGNCLNPQALSLQTNWPYSKERVFMIEFCARGIRLKQS